MIILIVQLCMSIHAGFGHGVRRSLVSLGSVLGSLWAASALQLNSNYLLYGVPIGLLLLAIVRVITNLTIIITCSQTLCYVYTYTAMGFMLLWDAVCTVAMKVSNFTNVLFLHQHTSLSCIQVLTVMTFRRLKG